MRMPEPKSTLPPPWGPPQVWPDRMPPDCVTAGREPKYESGDELWDAVVSYFRWVEGNPIQIASQSKAGLVRTPKHRTPTLQGLSCHLGISRSDINRWCDPKVKGHRADLAAVIDRATAYIHSTMIELANAGAANGVLAARYVGLSEKTETKTDMPVIEALRSEIDPDMICNLTHFDDPDPTGLDTGVFPRPLYSKKQLEAGIPFTQPQEAGKH